MSKTSAGSAEKVEGVEETPGVMDASDGAPVSEEMVWKSRALEAEARVEELEARVSELESALGRARETIERIERRGEIDRELTAARAVDLETGRLLTEAVLAEMDEPDVAVAVRELCRRKPFLFGGVRHGTGGGVSMSPAQGEGKDEELTELARRARSSGDQGELLRYLRARRVV